ncbi:transposase [Ponticoccus alexandrii]|uniref:transposase n=1 Tax=Ponticoccus alexandrii TaxID=1943633 RepID=UPI003D80B81C
MLRKLSREFKVEAVKPVTERGISVSQACRDRDLAESVLRRRMREAVAASPRQRRAARRSDGDCCPEGGCQAQGGAWHPEPGRTGQQFGGCCPDEGRSGLQARSDMPFAFLAKHGHIRPVSWMCVLPGVSRSGFHAWLKRAISGEGGAPEMDDLLQSPPPLRSPRRQAIGAGLWAEN